MAPEISHILSFLYIYLYTVEFGYNGFGYNVNSRAGQVRKLVRKSANPQLRTSEKSCGHADLRTFAV